MIILEALRALLGRRSGSILYDPRRPGLWSWASAAGITVTADTALTYSAIYCAVTLLSQTEAVLPFPVFKRLTPRGKERFRTHPNYTLLHDRPNPEMGSLDFRQCLMGHVLMWGNAYAEIELNGAGKPLALWPLRPDRTEPKRTSSGQLYYEVRDKNGHATTLLPEQVLHFKGVSFDGLVGYSVIRLARESIGLGLATERFGSSFFGSGAQPGSVLQHPAKLSDKAYERLKETQEEKIKGLGKAHRMMILEEGMKWEKIGIPPNDAQFLETRQFQVTDIARWFNLPPHKLKDLERATFGNIEEQNIEFIQDSVMPWLVTIEQECNWKLFSTAEHGEVFAEHVVAGFLRGDMESRYKAYAIGRQWGWLSANDVCELENTNPLPGKQGDMYMVPMNMAGADAVLAAKATGSRHAIDCIIASHRPLLESCARRVVTKEVLAFKRSVKLPLREQPRQAIERFYADHADYFIELMEPAVIALAGALCTVRACVVPPGYLRTLAAEHVARAQQELNGADGHRAWTPESVQECMDLWHTQKPASIADRIITDLNPVTRELALTVEGADNGESGEVA